MKGHEHVRGTRQALQNPREVLLAGGLMTGQTLLDIGTGSGYLALAAREIVGDRGKVYAVDSYPESIRTLEAAVREQDISGVELRVADAAREMPVPARSVDICLMSNVLHGFAANRELEGVMAGVRKVLRDDGKILVVDFNKTETPFGPPLDVRLSPGEMEALLAGWGFDATRRFEAGPYHYALVFERKTGR